MEQLLGPKARQALESGVRLLVKLDEVAGLPASFLDEAFGGLIRRSAGFTRVQADAVLEIVSFNSSRSDISKHHS